jgi:hypothetical protein
MVSRAVIVGAVLAGMLLWWGPFTVPNWAVIGLVLVLVALSMVLSVKRMRIESRLARTLWLALTRKNSLLSKTRTGNRGTLSSRGL